MKHLKKPAFDHWSLSGAWHLSSLLHVTNCSRKTPGMSFGFVFAAWPANSSIVPRFEPKNSCHSSTISTLVCQPEASQHSLAIERGFLRSKQYMRQFFLRWARTAELVSDVRAVIFMGFQAFSNIYKSFFSILNKGAVELSIKSRIEMLPLGAL